MDPGPAPAMPRSLLYVPADKPHLFAKATAGGADAVVLDLEDAVPLAGKDDGRAHVNAWLRGREPGSSGAEQWVRVSADTLEEDLRAAITPALDGLFLAKCDLEALCRTVAVLDRTETRERAPDAPPVRVVGLVETAQGLLDLVDVARHPRLTTLGIGEADLLGELRMARTEQSAASLDHLRTQVVVACAAARAAAPVAPTSTAFRDLETFARTTRHLRDLGFRSRTAIHPGQVPVIHEVLTPDAAEVARADDVLRRFAAAAGGVTTDADGRLIDAAVVRGARETMSRHEAAMDRMR